MTGHEIGTGGHGPAEIELSGADLDLLADYLGGALEGTPAHTEVARRIASDGAWRRTHDALEAASAHVAADLSAWGRVPAPMPDDVSQRLTAALLAAGSATTPADHLQEVRAGSPRERAGRLSVVPWERSAPRRRIPRWAGPLAVAATVLAFVGFGLRALPDITGGSDDGGPAADAQASSPELYNRQEGAGAAALATLPIERVVASGTAYRSGTLRAVDQELDVTMSREPAGTPPDVSGPDPAVPVPAGVPSELLRLLDPASLRTCLTAIGDSHPQSATSVELVDYATYEGRPALVVVFTDATGEQWAWVSGPRCGLPGAGADTVTATAVG